MHAWYTELMSLASTAACDCRADFIYRLCLSVREVKSSQVKSIQSINSTFSSIFTSLFHYFIFENMSRRKSIFLSSQETQSNLKQLDEFSNEIDQNLRTLAYIHPFTQTEKTLLVKVHFLRLTRLYSQARQIVC